MRAIQEKCCEILEFAAAEMRDVSDGFHASMTCPVLSALATADRKKSDPGMFVSSFLTFLQPIQKSPVPRNRSCSALSRTNKEEAVTTVFRLNNFYYPVDISYEDNPPLCSFPWIRPSNFIKSMAKMNDLGHLLGGHSLQSACGILLDFWSKYRALFPQHELRRDVDAGLKPLSHCLPILFHGDEGVTYRKSGLLVLSIQGIFGHGSSKRDENFRGATQGIPLNFLRTGFQTRLLVCVCPKDFG